MTEKKQDAFTEYIKNRGGSNPIGLSFSPYQGSIPPGSSGSNRGWLATLTDFLNIGVYPGTTLANSIFELPSKIESIQEKVDLGDPAGAAAETAGAVFDVVSAPVRGITTPVRRLFGGELAEDEGKTFSEVIERSTDVVNRYTPGYVDTEDNVNTWVKGGAGLALDIVADPLTWVTGGMIVPAKLAARGAVTASKAARAVENTVENANRIPTAGEAATRGLPEAAALPNLSAVDRLSVQGSIRPRATKNEGVDNFPAVTASEQIKKSIDESVLNSKPVEDAVSDLLRKQINNKFVKASDGKQYELRGAISSIFQQLKTVPSAEKAKLINTAGSYLKALRSDVAKQGGNVRLDEVIPGYRATPISGSSANIAPTVAGALKQYDQVSKVDTLAARALREAIEQRVLIPLQTAYNAGVRGGKNINTFGIPKTASEAARIASNASVAETVIGNIQRLSEASKARASMLLGEDLFRLVSNMQANDMAKFLDDLEIVLRSDGLAKSIDPLLGNEASSRLLELFDINAAMYTAAKLDVAERLQDVIRGERAEDLETVLKQLSEEANVAPTVEESLSFFGVNVPAGSADNAFEIVTGAVNAASKAALINVSPKLRKKRGYEYQTDEGVSRTDEIFGEGQGVIPNTIASYAQYNYILAAAKHIDDVLKSGKFEWLNYKNLSGAKRASVKEALTLASIRTLENALEAAGLPIVMDMKLFKNSASIVKNLKFSDAYLLVAKSSPEAQNFMRLVFFNQAATALPFTKFMDSVMTAVLGGSREEIEAVLRSTEKRNRVRMLDETGKPVDETPRYIDNWLSNTGRSTDPKKNAWGKYSTDEVAKVITDAIVKNTPELILRTEVNAQKFIARGLAEAEAISANAAEIIVKLLNDPLRVVQSGLTVAKAGRLVGDVAETIGDVTDLGVVLGNMRTNLSLGKNFKGSAETTVALAEAVAKRNPAVIARAQEKSYRQAQDVVRSYDDATAQVVEDVLAGRRTLENPASQKMVDEIVAEAVSHADDGLRAVSSGAYASIKANSIKAMNFLNKAFNVNRGMKTDEILYGSVMFRGLENLQHQLASKILIPLNEIGKKYTGFADAAKTETIVQAAYNAIRQGIKADGVVGQAQEELTPIVARFFNLDGIEENAVLGNLFIRGAFGIERINQVFVRYDVLGTTARSTTRSLDQYFDAGRVLEELGPNPSGAQVMNALSEQWKEWDVRDPILFLDRLTRAAMQLSAEVSYVTGIRSDFLEIGLTSLKPKAGYVRMSSSMDATLAQHIQEDFWAHPDVAEMFQATSDFLDELAKPGALKIGSQIDEFTDAMKYAMTQARLGHHVRNYAGGLSMTGVGMGAKYFGRAHSESWHVTKMLGQVTEKELIDVMARLDEPLKNVRNNLPESLRVVHKSQNGKVQVTRGDIADAITRYGIDPSVAVAESFAVMGAAGGGVGKFMQKFLAFVSLGAANRGGRVEKFWSTLSQRQDHLNRNHMFIQYVMQALDGKAMPRGIGKTVKFDLNKPDVLEDIYTFAAERVAKFHPTIQGLTAWERKIPRRLFPFYSWNKGAVMALSEAIVMYPGRVSWPFKASYNLAVATGVDPNSFYDPFPTDQRFPSFMTEDINGPQFVVNGNYYGIQPGLAQFDILNQFAASDNALAPGYQAIVSSLNPGIKLPIELITQSRMSTRSPIADISDYVDSSIPNVTYWSNLTTLSPSSLFVDGELQQNAKYESGAKTDVSRLFSLANWITGFGLTEFSRSDFGNLAKTEESTQLREEQERSQ